MKKTLLFLSLALAFIFQGARADEPFRKHRYDAFKPLAVTSEDIVFVGNSITNMHPWGEAFGNPKILNRGVSGAVSDEALANIESVIMGHPKKIFLMIGTNDLGTNGINNAAHVATNVRHILTRIRRESPQTEVYVQSILPSRLRNATLQKETNDSLRNICTEYGITYIDLWNKLQTLANSYSHTLDGLHLTASGYRIWGKAIEQYVGSDCVYADTATNKTAGLSGALGMRATYFGMLPVHEGDVLMVGDEQVNGGEWQELLHCDRVLNRGTAWGYSGGDISNITAELPVILKGQKENGCPAAIFFYAGAANVNNTSNALADVATAYAAMVKKALALAPTAKVYVQSLVPVQAAATNTSRVVPFNAMLKAFADTTDRVEYVDCYTPLVKDGAANTAYFSGNYLYGRGYAKLSQVIAPLIGDDARATTDAEADSLYTLYNARTTLGTTLTTLASLSVGTGVGQYLAADTAALNAEVTTAYGLLATADPDLDAISNEGTKLSAALNELLPKIILPTTSTDTEAHWYKLSTPLRDGRFLTSNGASQTVTGNTEHNYANGMWKFVSRTDGRFDIVNRADGTYLSPASSYNSAIRTVATAPTAGWTLSYAATPGYFIISSDKVQLNQTQSGLSYALYNWSSGQSGTDRSDTGCQFLITEAGEPDELPEVDAPVLALTDITLDGTAPYRVPAEIAAPVMAATNVTVAVDFTPKAATSAVCVLVGSSAETATDYFALITRDTQKYGVQYIGDNNKEGWYTQSGRSFTSRTQVVLTMNGTTEAYGYYYGGSYDRAVSGMGAYGYRSFGNVPSVSGLFLGGVITKDNANQYPFSGTIHSVRFWDKLLTASEIAALDYDNVTPTGITSPTIAPGAADDAVYDLSGRRVANPSRGLYITGGKKVIVK